MMLQTLVENAIKHGISHSVKGGTITIQAKLADNRVHISVSNPGQMKKEALHAEGVGLENSKNRLNLLFGDTAQLSIRPLDKNQVEASMVLPYLEEI
jgi:LytS/YehU family sensor histidine kinase